MGSVYIYCKVHCRFILQKKKVLGITVATGIFIAVSRATTLAKSETYYRNVTTPLSIAYTNLLCFFEFISVTIVILD